VRDRSVSAGVTGWSEGATFIEGVGGIYVGGAVGVMDTGGASCEVVDECRGSSNGCAVDMIGLGSTVCDIDAACCVCTGVSSPSPSTSDDTDLAAMGEKSCAHGASPSTSFHAYVCEAGIVACEFHAGMAE